MPVRHSRGFSLVEVLVGLAIFGLFAAGIYSSIKLIFKVVYQSRVHIVETAILNEQIELIRNLPYEDVGIVSSTPAGILQKTVDVIRNGVTYSITRTIRNVDDPFDGTITSEPADTSPADYKFIQVTAFCATCSQETAISLMTTVTPSYMEDSEDTGALIVGVYDASAQPVADAQVHIVSASTTIDMTDVTDEHGQLSVVGLSPATSTYFITVTKNGYTSEMTRASSQANPNPTIPPITITAQRVSAVSFFIDKVASLNLSTVDDACNPVTFVPFSVVGTSLIGANPDKYLVNENRQTDSNGLYASSSLHWDSLYFTFPTYDLVGTLPGLPISVLPDGAHEVIAVLGPGTNNSLLVYVRDRITGQPLSSASVTVTTTLSTHTSVTGIGSIRQTAWNGGSGQSAMADLEKYWSDDNGISVTDSPGDILLRNNNGTYAEDGVLESSTFDLGTQVRFLQLLWEPLAQPPETGEGIRFQIATSNSSTPSAWLFTGYDGTQNTYYDSAHRDVHEINNDRQYLRYKVFLHSNSATTTPTLSDVSLSFTTACTPPGQAYFGDLSATTSTLTVSLSGYQTVVETIPVQGEVFTVVDMTPSE